MSSTNIKHLLLVGSPGVGKSTIVKYLTGEDVKISEFFTSKMTMYSINETLKILDTVGCEDSSGKPTENILQDILKYIGPTDSFCSKIIWVVGNPTKRRLPELQKQAKWINKLTSNDAIWSSVIIIGRQFYSDESFSGALGCIKKEGSNIKPICKRLHLLDLCSKDDMAVIGFGNLQFEKRIKHGCLFTKELKGWLLNELNKISFCSIGFKKKHNGTKVLYHYGSKKYCHYGKKIRCHYRGKQFVHPSNKKFYHYGNIKYYHIGFEQKTSEGSQSRFLRWSCCSGDEYSHPCTFEKWNCCNNIYRYSEGCKFEKWDCCNNEDEYSEGCKFQKWICCNRYSENSTGCKFEKWECCNSYNENSTGCKFEKWTCCKNKQENTDGCRFKKWTCCKNGENHSGCTVYAVI